MRQIFFGFLLLACTLFVASPAAAQNGTLFIKANPADALVRIMNISPPYEAGMSLKPGVYDIEVSKEGYVSERRDVTVKGGQKNSFTFTLKEAPPEGTLVIATEPSDALVRIMNIAPPYEEGMSLAQGEYKLEISKPGFKTLTRTLTLQAGQENRFAFTLESAAPEPVTEPNATTQAPQPADNQTAAEPTPAPETEPAAAEEAPAESAPQAMAEAEQKPGVNGANGTLTVVTEPEDASARIMNIKPAYEDGIELEPGLYALEVSHPGYVTQSLDYAVEAGTENTVTVTLAPEQGAAQEEAPADAQPAPAAEEPAMKMPAMKAAYEEEFQDNGRNWYETTTPQVEIAVQDGHYHIAHKDDAQGWIAWNKAEFDPEADFAIEAVFRKVDGVLDYGYGVIWGVTNKGAAYHSFRISGNGLYSYRQENEGQATTVIDWTPSNAIEPGLGATNTIQVRRQGDTLEFYVNGELVDTADYVQPPGTMVGFKVDNRQTVDVESLKVGAAQ